jgi:hypothetical protein
VRVNDVVDAFNLQSMGSMDKKGVLEWVKGYLKVSLGFRVWGIRV